MSMSLFEPPPVVPEHRVAILARVIAGFRWPDRGSFERLTKPQRDVCVGAARSCLERLAAEPDG